MVRLVLRWRDDHFSSRGVGRNRKNFSTWVFGWCLLPWHQQRRLPDAEFGDEMTISVSEKMAELEKDLLRLNIREDLHSGFCLKRVNASQACVFNNSQPVKLVKIKIAKNMLDCVLGGGVDEEPTARSPKVLHVCIPSKIAPFCHAI